MKTISFVIQSSWFLSWQDLPITGLTLESGLRRLDEVARADSSRRYRLVRRVTVVNDQVIKRR